jgi:selenium metabolism protein YedF
MTETVDARGLPCPQPVILTRNALKENTSIITLVDTETAQENVARMAKKAGATVRVERHGGAFHLHITQEGGAPTPTPAASPTTGSGQGPLVLVIPSDVMGRGDAELGHILIRGFFHTLGEVEPMPDTVIFFNSGVKLVVEGSPVLDDLRALRDQGLEILACGTCLGHYALKDQVAVGEISNMYTIAETLLNAGKVISL